MSRMIPQATVNAFRQFTNVSVKNYGIDCTLYIPSNLNTVETYDMYAKPSDLTFTQYSTQVFIEWSMNKHKLHKMGIFMEDEAPTIAWFSNVKKSAFGTQDDIDITIGSYFQISMQYVPGNLSDTDKFEIVDVLVPSAHDAVVTKCFKIAPFRVKA